MNILVDANILLRLADPTSKSHVIAGMAVSALCSQGEVLIVVPQSVYEFWVVATRPISSNGLGLSLAECLKEVRNIEATFLLLDDKPAMFTEWKGVVSAFACQGKVAHDARYVAAMRTHGITQVLTFNVGDFSRYTGVTVLDPNKLATPGPPATGS